MLCASRCAAQYSDAQVQAVASGLGIQAQNVFILRPRSPGGVVQVPGDLPVNWPVDGSGLRLPKGGAAIVVRGGLLAISETLYAAGPDSGNSIVPGGSGGSVLIGSLADGATPAGDIFAQDINVSGGNGHDGVDGAPADPCSAGRNGTNGTRGGASGAIWVLAGGRVTLGELTLLGGNGGHGGNGTVSADALGRSGGRGGEGGRAGDGGDVLIDSWFVSPFGLSDFPVVVNNIDSIGGMSGCGGHAGSGILPSQTGGNAPDGGDAGSIKITGASGTMAIGTIFNLGGPGGAGGNGGDAFSPNDPGCVDPLPDCYSASGSRSGRPGHGGAGGSVFIQTPGDLRLTSAIAEGGPGGGGGREGNAVGGICDRACFAPGHQGRTGGRGGVGGSLTLDIGGTLKTGVSGSIIDGGVISIGGPGAVGYTAGAPDGGITFGPVQGGGGGDGGAPGPVWVQAGAISTPLLPAAAYFLEVGGNGGPGGDGYLASDPSSWPCPCTLPGCAYTHVIDAGSGVDGMTQADGTPSVTGLP